MRSPFLVNHVRAIAGLAAVVVVAGLARPSAAQGHPSSDATHRAVVAGMKCKQSSLTTPQLDCTYEVGRGVAFVIAGVGEPDVSITVTRATGYDTDYYVTVGMGHGCVIVKPGRLTREAALKRGELARMAFVSPVDGKVYQTWEQCSTARRSR